MSTTIGGYILSDCIGRGSYSSVFKAHKNRGNYEVAAIKRIKVSNLSRKSRDNIINEINILRKIEHKNVVQMKEFTWDAKNIYLILEYCPGGNLAEFIKKKGRLSELLVQHFAQQLVQGLEVLHVENIVHSDLKPANILLSIPPIGSCRNVQLKIADFGFSSKLQDDEKYVMGVKGSPLYMAPEVLALQPYSSKADLYSFGTILYECLYGSAPYKSLDLNALTKEILSSNQIKISKKIDISEDCYDLIQRLLVKDQEKRMNFEELHQHPFIDMEHCPTLDNYYKGVNLVRQATMLDEERKHEIARVYYIEGLQYLMPTYNWLDSFNSNQRRWLMRRILEYCARAEKLTLHQQH